MSTDGNELIYERRWAASTRVVRLRPHVWRGLAGSLEGQPLLEIGPGLRPTIPVEGSYFAEISSRALDVLARRGAHVRRYAGGSLPFPDRFFGGVFAFEVLEHVQEDNVLAREIARVLHTGGRFMLSVPIRMSRWSRLDELSAHVRRYEPDELFDLLRRNGFRVESCEFKTEKIRPGLVTMKASVLQSFPRLTNTFLQGVFFPLLAGYQRRFAEVRWLPPEAAIPAEATGITVLTRLVGTTARLAPGGGDLPLPAVSGAAFGAEPAPPPSRGRRGRPGRRTR
ncbi:MAG: class I SAM-dependent methyltransferase [Actinomycetota bacterium]